MERLIEYVKVGVKNPCFQEHITTLPDTDILLVYKKEDMSTESIEWHPLYIVSCKTSFHARETEALFWALLAKASKIDYVLVTEDSDRYSQRHNSELGTCQEGNRVRRLLEAFLDRVYIIKKYGVEGNDLFHDISRFLPQFERAEASGYRGIESHIFDDPERRSHAGYCDMVRPFDDLLFDSMRKKFEKLRS